MTENELTYQIRGAVWDVYNILGPGLLESVYEEALCYELHQRGIKVERQVPVPIIYKGVILNNSLKLDLIVEDRIIIELKSVDQVKSVFFKQLKTYLRLLGKPLGLLVNFGENDMKKTQRIDAFRNIRRNRVSFLSIVFISLMAVTAYLGLSFSAEGIRRSGDAAYVADRTADIEINAASLMTRADLEAVLATEGVADAEGVLFAPSRVGNGLETRDIMLRTLPERMSLPELAEGAFPASADECAVEKELAEKFGFQHRRGDCRAVYGNHRFGCAGTVFVDEF